MSNQDCLAAQSGRNIQVFRTVELLCNGPWYYVERRSCEALPAITDIAAAILIFWNRDDDRSVPIGHNVRGMAGVVVERHVGSKPSRDMDRSRIVRIIIQTHQQVRPPQPFVCKNVEVLPSLLGRSG